MIFRAYVSVGGGRAVEKRLTTRPVKHGHIQFEHNGEMVDGRITLIAPHDWEATGTTPTITAEMSDPKEKPHR